MELKFGLPKGSLQDATFKLFEKAGWNFRVDSRSYHPVVNDPEISAILMRPQEIPRYLEDGILDAGLTGKDWIEDNGADVYEVCELTYSKVTRNPMRIVVAAPETPPPGVAPIDSIRDLAGKRIATEYVRLTERYLRENGITDARVEFSWGADEMKVPVLADAIVVNTENRFQPSRSQTQNRRYPAYLNHAPCRQSSIMGRWGKAGKNRRHGDASDGGLERRSVGRLEDECRAGPISRRGRAVTRIEASHGFVAI